MAQVHFSKAAERAFKSRKFPPVMRDRVTDFIELLEARWPDISGPKQLTGKLHNTWSKRLGKYRVLFEVHGDAILFKRIDLRKDVYDD